jgi:Uma2 family endonuclease
VLSELNVLCGENQRDRIIPDITVALREAEYRDGDLAAPAVFCVEILSPGQTLSNILDRAERLLKAGTPMCWVIWPERRQAWMYTVDGLQQANESLRAAVPDEGAIEIPLSEMWAEID